MKRTKRGKAIAGVVIGLAGISLGAIGFSSWIIGIQDTTEIYNGTTVTVDGTTSNFLTLKEVTDRSSLTFLPESWTIDKNIRIAESADDNTDDEQVTQYIKSNGEGADFKTSFLFELIVGDYADPFVKTGDRINTLDIALPTDNTATNAAMYAAADAGTSGTNATGYHGATIDKNTKKYFDLDSNEAGNATSSHRITLSLYNAESNTSGNTYHDTTYNEANAGYKKYYIYVNGVTFKWGDYFEYERTGSTPKRVTGPINFYNYKMHDDTTSGGVSHEGATMDTIRAKCDAVQKELDLMKAQLNPDKGNHPTVTLKADVLHV